jgi:hypothetical protein
MRPPSRRTGATSRPHLPAFGGRRSPTRGGSLDWHSRGSWALGIQAREHSMISSRRLRAITGGVAAVMLSALVTATPTEASRPTAASVERAVRVSVHGPAHVPLKVRSLTAHGRAAHAGKRATVTLYERSGRRWHRVGKSKRLRSGGKYGFYRKHREGGTYRYRVTVRSRTGKLLDRSKVLRTHAHSSSCPHCRHFHRLRRLRPPQGPPRRLRCN